jgi:hypothetical protein
VLGGRADGAGSRAPFDVPAEGRVVAERTGKLIAHGTTTCLMSRNGNARVKDSVAKTGPAAIRTAGPA